MTKYIKKYSGEIVGIIEESSNGDKTIKEWSGRILGYYDASRDCTKLFSGVIIAWGDVSGLFFKDKIKL